MQQGVLSSAKHQKTKSLQKVTIHQLPEEIVLYIFNFLSLNDLARALLWSKGFGRIAVDNKLWKKFVLQYFDDNQVLANQNFHQFFLQKLSSAFDRRLFPELTSEQNLIATVKGDMNTILNSIENRKTKTALLGAAVAMGNLEILPQINTKTEMAIVKALCFAAVNQNRTLPELLSSLPFIHSSLQKIVFRILIRMGKENLINEFLETLSIESLRNLLKISMEHHGTEHSFTQMILTILNEGNVEKPEYKIISRRIYIDEPAQKGKWIEYLKLLYQTMTIGRAVREVPLDFTALKEPNKPEKKHLKGLSRHPSFLIKMTQLAITQGYVNLIEKMAPANIISKNKYPLLGLGDANLDPRPFKQRVIDKLFLRAIRMQLLEQTTQLAKQASLFLVVQALLKVVEESNFALMNIILETRGQDIPAYFLDKAISICKDDVAKSRIKHAKNSTKTLLGLVPHMVNSIFSERNNLKAQEEFLSDYFSQEIADCPAINDLTHPVTLTLSFDHSLKMNPGPYFKWKLINESNTLSFVKSVSKRR